MKRLMKILIWILGIFALIFVIATIIIALYGKKIVESQIEQNLKMKARLGGMSLSFPFTVNLNNLEIGTLFKAAKISISPNIFSLFPGKLVLGKVVLIKPQINLEQGPDGALNIPEFKQKGKQPPVFITGLIVKEGRFIFTDKKVTPEGLKVILDNVFASISKVTFPLTSLTANFKVSADIMDADYKSIGSAATAGYIDFMRKDMDANVNIKDLNVIYFEPYYGDFISKKKLLSAKLNLNTALKAQNNDLDINSNLRLSELVYAKVEQKEGEVPELNLAKDALDLFTDSEGNLNLNFEVRTKLDNPSLSPKQLKKVILRAALNNLMNANPQTLIDKVQQNIGQFKEIGKQFKKIFK